MAKKEHFAIFLVLSEAINNSKTGITRRCDSLAYIWSYFLQLIFQRFHGSFPRRHWWAEIHQTHYMGTSKNSINWDLPVKLDAVEAYRSIQHEKSLIDQKRPLQERTDRCWLKGATGYALHAILCDIGYNLRWLLLAIARMNLSSAFASTIQRFIHTDRCNLPIESAIDAWFEAQYS
jgi:hypothetical protein